MASTAQRFLRARDDDRNRAVEQIDAAYADGQITLEEHDARCATALRARTLSELNTIVNDLQTTTGGISGPAVIERNEGIGDLLGRIDWAAPLRLLRGGLVLLAVVVVGALVIGGWALTQLAGSASTGDFFDSGSFGSDDAEAAYDGPGPQTPEGFARMLDDLDADAESTVVSSAVIYPEYAVLNVVSPDDPRLTSSYYYGEGELRDSTGETSLKPDAPVLDLREVNIERAQEWMEEAPKRLDLPDANEAWLNISSFLTEEMRVMVYVSNKYNDAAYLVTTASGRLTYESPFTG